MKKLFLLLLLIPFNVKAISASSYVLMDMDNNTVLQSSNMNNTRSVASISKIMTCILGLESNKLNDTVVVGDEILHAYGSAVYLSVDEELTLKDLLYALMLRSGNDAALSIAAYVGGDVTNFIKMMNDKAKEIGMTNTTFNNPHGLDSDGGNISTAYDMALLTSYAMKNDVYREIVGSKKYSLKTNKNYYSWTNKNKLLKYDYITGGKTGFTEIARRTLVTTASKNNINLVAVTLNDGNDFNDHITLFDEAFKKYTNYQILNKGEIDIIGEKYYHDSTFYIKNNYSYNLESIKNKVLLNIKLIKKNSYSDNDEIGNVEVIINDKKVHEEKIYIKKENKKSFVEKIKEWVSNIW